MDDMPGAFHTILSDGRRPEVEESEAERREIERHVGYYIVTWGYIDLFLGMAVAAISKPRRHDADFKGMFSADKIKLLASVLPATWPDRAVLLDLLEDGRRYRNALAHSNLAMAGTDEDGNAYGWHFWNIKGAQSRMAIDDGQMWTREMVARITQQAVLGLLADHYVLAQTPHEFGQHQIADGILAAPGQWDTLEDFVAFRSRVRKLFGSGNAGGQR